MSSEDGLFVAQHVGRRTAMKKENRYEAAQFFRDSPAQPLTSDVLAKRRAELIENLALLVVRKHRLERSQPPVQTHPSSSPVPSTS
jgi:hypothetical protein